MDVLQTLVAQFTDPFACLRELIQNALDAGSDVVEVNTSMTGKGADKQYVLEVQDHGEGMDRAIIDSQLTRLFSSSKDGDLTKIGKFGVGFVSVFALNPVAVCVDTARAGERWRVVFGRDRSFTRIKLDDPIEGTRVRMFLDEAVVKHHGGWDSVVVKARQAVAHWCRHVEKELLFDGHAINRPLELAEHALTVTRDDGAGTVVVAGIPRPSGMGTAGGGTAPVTVGFYNKGLTLLEASSWNDVPVGVSVRVSSRWLEHTLTRDSVVRDDRYLKAMKLVRAVVDDDLLPKALETLEASEDPLVRGPLIAWLVGRLKDRKLKKRALFRGVGGARFSVDDVAGGKCFLVGLGGDSGDVAATVAAAAAAAGQLVFAVNPSRLRTDADAFSALCDKKVPVLSDRFAAAVDVDAERAPRAARLADVTRRVLDAAGLLKGASITLAKVVGGPSGSAMPMAWRSAGLGRLLLVSGDDGALVARAKDALVVDVVHPEVAALLSLSARDTPLAAFLLAKLLLPIPLAAAPDSALAAAALRVRTEGAAS
ncbi:MAG: ATP-binding protein [Deltaproteobacteria bacterium]|nr:ATP-binding protein [Deltaproteobacteria bacterium]